MITTDNALKIIINSVISKDGELISLEEALDRIAYDNIYSPIDSPNFDKSAMDGYALILQDSNKTFNIVKDEKDFAPGCAMRVNTGFPIPKGADLIVEVEKVSVKGTHLTLILDNIEKYRNFTFKASEFKKGTLLVEKGERISVRKHALIAYSSIAELKVYKKPIVGIITTGNEVIFPGDAKQENKVYNANCIIAEGLVKKWGCDAVYFGHVKDSIESLKEHFRNALAHCDILVTTGGVSMGSADFTKRVLKDIGANIVFDKIDIKPGKPMTFGMKENKLIFAMPGWPAALYVTAYKFLRPALYKFAGRNNYMQPNFDCKTEENLHSRTGKHYVNNVNVKYRKSNFYCKKSGSQKTDNFYSVAGADGFVEIEKDKGNVSESETLPLVLLDD